MQHEFLFGIYVIQKRQTIEKILDYERKFLSVYTSVALPTEHSIFYPYHFTWLATLLVDQ